MSSWIDTIEYDAHEDVAVMNLKDGSSYEYKSVSEDIVTEWNDAESQGEYFVNHIRSNHNAEKR